MREMNPVIKNDPDGLAGLLDDDSVQLDDDTASLLDDDQKDPVFGTVEYTEDPEKDYKAELDASQEHYRQSRKAEADMMRDTFDSEFWCCLVFDSRKQKDAFLDALNWRQHGEKYLDGVTIAKSLGIDLPDVGALKLYTEKENKKLTELTKDPS